MKYENTFKAIDQILWKEQGCGSELDYLEQKSWMLFLKYLDDLETEREDEAELEGKTYKRLVSGFYRWSQWATPKKRDPQTGKMVLDTVNAMSGHTQARCEQMVGKPARCVRPLGIMIDNICNKGLKCTW